MIIEPISITINGYTYLKKDLGNHSINDDGIILKFTGPIPESYFLLFNDADIIINDKVFKTYNGLLSLEPYNQDLLTIKIDLKGDYTFTGNELCLIDTKNYTTIDTKPVKRAAIPRIEPKKIVDVGGSYDSDLIIEEDNIKIIGNIKFTSPDKKVLIEGTGLIISLYLLEGQLNVSGNNNVLKNCSLLTNNYYPTLIINGNYVAALNCSIERGAEVYGNNILFIDCKIERLISKGINFMGKNLCPFKNLNKINVTANEDSFFEACLNLNVLGPHTARNCAGTGPSGYFGLYYGKEGPIAQPYYVENKTWPAPIDCLRWYNYHKLQSYESYEIDPPRDLNLEDLRWRTEVLVTKQRALEKVNDQIIAATTKLLNKRKLEPEIKEEEIKKPAPCQIL